MSARCLPSTHSAAEVALNQSLGVQLGPEILAELHQLGAGQTGHQSLILLHHGPARVLQDQQTNVPEKEARAERGDAKRGQQKAGGFSIQVPHVSPLEGIIDLKMSRRVRWKCQRGKKKKKGQMVNNSLAEFLWFNEDVEVGFLELLSEHAEDIRGGREISQVVNDQVEQQLTREVWRERRITSQ